MSFYESQWRRLVSDEPGSFWTSAARAGLGLAAAGYGAGISAYRATYDSGLLRASRLPCPVIGVGNLTLGGTGKTTMVRWLATFLSNQGRHPAILSRGYRARGAGDGAVVSDAAGIHLDAALSGDEPQMLARSLPGVPVLIGKDRRRTGRLALETCQADVCVLDDGFQYWNLQKDLEVLLVNASQPLDRQHLFPRGTLREPLGALKRADLVVLTHADRAGDTAVGGTRDFIRRLAPSIPVATAMHGPCGFRALINGPGPEEPGTRWLAFSSTGDPESFPSTLRTLGVALESVTFPDHHAYAESHVRGLVEQAAALGCTGLVTTEKDAVKIDHGWLGTTPTWVLSVELRFLEGAQAVEERVLDCLAKAP